jgi:hypothetical protein
MDSADLADRERFEQATSLLMASLQKSRALNTELREALQRREQADVAGQPDPSDQSSSTVFQILSDIIDGVSHP